MSGMSTAMSNIFAAIRPALPAIDAIITRVILRFWIATLQAQLRHGRELQH
jgi:hypothetical protein